MGHSAGTRDWVSPQQVADSLADNFAGSFAGILADMELEVDNSRAVDHKRAAGAAADGQSPRFCNS